MITHLTLSLVQLCLMQEHATTQTQTPNYLPLEVTQGECGDSPSNTYFISKDTEFSQISNCPMVNSSVFINGEYDVTTLNYMENITMIHGDVVLQNSHNVYNLKGLQNLGAINGEDLYLDRYALYITNNENLAFVDKVNWSKITFNNEIFLDYAERSNRIPCYNECDGCFGPGPYLCQSCLNYTFLDNQTCTGVCENVLSDTEKLCQVRPPNNLFIDYLTSYSNIYVDWGSNDIYRELIDGYRIYYNGDMAISTFINDNRYFFDKSDLRITDTISNLVPGSIFNFSMEAHSKFGYSPLLTEQIKLKYYSPNNFTQFNITNIDNSEILISWTPPLFPDELFFTNNTINVFYEYYLDTEDNSGVVTNDNISFFRLHYGEHQINIKTVVQVITPEDDYYFHGEYQIFGFNSIYTTTSPTTSQTTSPTTSQTTSPTTSQTTTTTTITTIFIPGHPTSITTTTTPGESGLPRDALIALIVFFTILGIALFILAVKYYKDKKNFLFLKRMNQNNIVDYANPVYETREYYSQDSDTVINRHGVMNNPVYLEPEDPEKDYYTI